MYTEHMKKAYIFLIAFTFISLLILYLTIERKNNLNLNKKKYTSEELWQLDFQKKKERKKKGYNKAGKPDMYTKYFKDITTKIGEKESSYKMNYKVSEFNKAVDRLKSLKISKALLNWVQRGPANVGGRTRALIIDPDDATNNTWFAGAATGGIWKTTNGGSTWTNLSDNFSNLSVNAIAMSFSNHNIIYAGTGESFPGGTHLKGNGMWKSVDKGNNWTQISSTADNEDFAYVNRIVIDKTNEIIVIAATETGIHKSADGGVSWTEAFTSYNGVEDLVYDPNNVNTLYAGVNSMGIFKSTDAGNTWTMSSDGLLSGNRYEVDVSSVNSNNIFASVNVNDTISYTFYSENNATTWKKFNDEQNFLGGQGEYDNIIKAHPYNANEAFIGGVDIWKVKFDGTEEVSEPTVVKAYTKNTTFLNFVNFKGGFLGGGMSNSEGTNINPSDWVSIEIRFGAGFSQKAHRFTVPDNSTSGVPASDYIYQNYIDVPFEVWDITNNRQLMVSVRDQEKDGEYNLYERRGDAYGQLGREYIYVNAVEYNPTSSNADIAIDGGQQFKNLYMFWPILRDGQSWIPNSLPNSKIIIEYGTIKVQNGVKTIIADSYGNFGGTNGYSQNAGMGNTSIPGLHPDHHEILILPQGGGNFTIINANDGGLAISTNNGIDFNQLPNNYITTQFYGVAKNPNANEYIGGMQDNGTWQSASGENASNTSRYLFRIGGDGFECLWHLENTDLLLGSIYNNDILKSNDKGSSWEDSQGISDGPFITRLSASKENPDIVFAVSGEGVYKSTDFGTSWELKNISANWSIDDGVKSSHNVEVSLSNGNIVWAGAGMASGYGYQLQVSTDEGETFNSVNDYSLVEIKGLVSGIATHPSEDSTAYTLFSLQGEPKLLRTKDLGNTWEDLSGFGTNNISSNGFPDVITHCLVVMPHAPNVLWVGTDIGLFESTDSGSSWHYADIGLPPVSVYNMQIVGKQIVLATHGRGIWTVDIEDIVNAPYIKSFEQINGFNLNININLEVKYDNLDLYINGVKDTSIQNTSIESLDIPIIVEENGLYTAKVIATIGGNTYKSNTIDLLIEDGDLTEEPRIYPNPSANELFIDFDSNVSVFTVNIYTLDGKKAYSNINQNEGKNEINISHLQRGMYIVYIDTGVERIVQKVKIIR